VTSSSSMDHARHAPPPPPVIAPPSISPSFSASLNLTTLTSSLAKAATQSALSSVATSLDGTAGGGAAPHPVSWLAMLGQGLLAVLKAAPGILVWTITFTTITLPTLLFALFSTSLTFTMNFTTLYVVFFSVFCTVHSFLSAFCLPSEQNTRNDC
jgi:hypothetical protein